MIKHEIMSKTPTQDKCKYCSCSPDYNKPLNMTSIEYSGIEMLILGNIGILRCRHFPNYDELFDAQDIVFINYCPMCERRFER